jgi:hypothetical protein
MLPEEIMLPPHPPILKINREKRPRLERKFDHIASGFLNSSEILQLGAQPVNRLERQAAAHR